MLRVQGEIARQEKERKAQVEQEVSFRKEHTFKPNTALTRKKSLKALQEKQPIEKMQQISISNVARVAENDKFNKLYK